MDSSAGKILQQASLQLQSAIQAVLISSSCVGKASKNGASPNDNQPTSPLTAFNITGAPAVPASGNNNANEPTNTGALNSTGAENAANQPAAQAISSTLVSVVSYATTLPAQDSKINWKRWRGHGL
jgi:hypothetical protein